MASLIAHHRPCCVPLTWSLYVSDEPAEQHFGRTRPLVRQPGAARLDACRRRTLAAGHRDRPMRRRALHEAVRQLLVRSPLASWRHPFGDALHCLGNLRVREPPSLRHFEPASSRRTPLTVATVARATRPCHACRSFHSVLEVAPGPVVRVRLVAGPVRPGQRTNSIWCSLNMRCLPLAMNARRMTPTKPGGPVPFDSSRPTPRARERLPFCASGPCPSPLVGGR